MRVGIFKRFLLFIFLTLVIPFCYVDADTIEYSRVGSISINNIYKDIKLSNVNLKLYKVASINNNGEYVFDTFFTEKEQDIKNMSSSKLGEYAVELNDFILYKNINYTSNKLSDENGVAKFENLELGLYLVVSDEIQKDNIQYKINPFIVELPSIDEVSNMYVYNINIYDKVEIIKDGNTSNILMMIVLVIQSGVVILIIK